VKRISLPPVVVSSTSCKAAVLWIDGFGNVITNVRESDLPSGFTANSLGIRCENLIINRFVSHYAAAPTGELVALIDSAGMFELSVVGGSAAERLRVGKGDSLELSWPA
jgi:S-adenosylmethionine hydrolase